ncbi:hypothetical protein FIBSPDRAFT_1039280 [Athelia psychrophila]|uniref:Uncharacterized protein n=1 Tax=Athelia psychrophila TaxID=1759441 RepID=A0A166S248_9AGAM|nr:hypothetical protein FIBSPDRAFT_1039280 [Fibularhizoctonia sp. CBS 109695]
MNTQTIKETAEKATQTLDPIPTLVHETEQTTQALKPIMIPHPSLYARTKQACLPTRSRLSRDKTYILGYTLNPAQLRAWADRRNFDTAGLEGHSGYMRILIEFRRVMGSDRLISVKARGTGMADDTWLCVMITSSNSPNVRQHAAPENVRKIQVYMGMDCPPMWYEHVPEN